MVTDNRHVLGMLGGLGQQICVLREKLVACAVSRSAFKNESTPVILQKFRRGPQRDCWCLKACL